MHQEIFLIEWRFLNLLTYGLITEIEVTGSSLEILFGLSVKDHVNSPPSESS